MREGGLRVKKRRITKQSLVPNFRKGEKGKPLMGKNRKEDFFKMRDNGLENIRDKRTIDKRQKSRLSQDG